VGAAVHSREILGSTYQMLQAGFAFCDAQRKIGICHDVDLDMPF
jgi:hypothetical protein